MPNITRAAEAISEMDGLTCGEGQAPSPQGPYVVGFAGLYDGRL